MIPANDIKKNDKLYKISNPETVQKNANKYYNGIIVYKSDKPNKKYFVIHNDKKIYFGASNYEDYTFHKNNKRLLNFRNRNSYWKNEPKYSSAHLSYYLLW